MFVHIALAFLLAITSVAAFGLLAVIRPSWFDPVAIIPTVGMLFNNGVSSVSLGLDALLKNLDGGTGREKVELFLSFGASREEAYNEQLRWALRVSLLPTLNSLAVMGLVSIPGASAGQILGGLDP